MLSGLGAGQQPHLEAKTTCVAFNKISAGHTEWSALVSTRLRTQLQLKHSGLLKPGDDMACVGAAEVCAQIKPLFKAFPDKRHVISCSSRGLQEASERYLQGFVRDGQVSPKASPMTTAGRLSQVASTALDARGMSSFVSATCASSLQAVVQGSYLLQSRNIRKEAGAVQEEEVAIVASDFAVTPFVVGSLKSLGVYAKKPASTKQPYQPWSSSNQGMMLGEGSMATILTSMVSKSVFAELIGAVSLTQPSMSTGLSEEFVDLVLRRLLTDSGVSAEGVDVYLAHGSGTTKGDRSEKAAVYKVFSKNHLEVKTYKSKFGHLLGSSGLANILMYEAERGQSLSSKDVIAVCLSLGFGGQATAVCLRYFS